jgi:universal stress protein E
MNKIRRILVGVKNCSARSMPAVAKAAQLAKAWDAEVELFHCLDQTVFLEPMTQDRGSLRKFERREREAAVAALDDVARKLRRHGVSTWAQAEWDFPAYEALIRRATKVKADLIVVERHASKHHATWLLSYTDWRLLQQAPVPVLLVKTAQPYRRPKLLAAVDPRHSHAKPSHLDHEILSYASGFAQALAGNVDVVYAFSPPIVIDAAAGFSTASALPPDLLENAERDAQRALDVLLQKQPMKIERQYLLNDLPAQAIATAAHKGKAKIVVMGAVSRSALKHFFVGSTAEMALDALPTDVLIVKPRGFVTRVAKRPRGTRVAVAPIGAVA